MRGVVNIKGSLVVCTILEKLLVYVYNITGDFIFIEVNVFKIDIMLCIFHKYEGVFLLGRINLKDRSVGFCNVNGLFIFLFKTFQN